MVLGFTLLLALGRVFIKLHKFRRLFIDDGLFIDATILLLAGTITVSLVLPYNQTEVNVGAGIEAPPSDLMHQLDMDVKFQDASSFLLNASVFAVKFSFLFFFRLLLQNTGRLQMLWWFVFIFTIPCAVLCMCTEFMVCPAFGDRILGKRSPFTSFRYFTDHFPCQSDVCVSNTALKRQIAVLYTVVVLDIVTDLLRKCSSEVLLHLTMLTYSHSDLDSNNPALER